MSLIYIFMYVYKYDDTQKDREIPPVMRGNFKDQ